MCVQCQPTRSLGTWLCKINRTWRGQASLPPRSRERDLMVVRWVFLVALGELPAMSELSVTLLVRNQTHMDTLHYLC